MATEPLGIIPGEQPAEPTLAVHQELAALRAEREDLLQRVAEAEEESAAMAVQLAAARKEAADLALFEQSTPLLSEPTLAADGSDPGVLPMALAGTAIVAAMVTVLAIINNGIFDLFTFFIAAVTCVLAYGAAATKVVPVEVTVGGRGMVYVKRGEETHTYDLRSESTTVEITGQPGDGDWSVKLSKRFGDPEKITSSMVDPQAFLAQLREWRPNL